MKVKIKLSPEDYLALVKFKRSVNQERTGKILKDHNNHLYMVDSNGSIRRLNRNDISSQITGSGREIPGINTVKP